MRARKNNNNKPRGIIKTNEGSSPTDWNGKNVGSERRKLWGRLVGGARERANQRAGIFPLGRSGDCLDPSRRFRGDQVGSLLTLGKISKDYEQITRRITGQSVVCRMVYTGTLSYPKGYWSKLQWAPSVLVTLHRWFFAVIVTLHRWLH